MVSRPSTSRTEATLNPATRETLRALGLALRAARAERGLTRDELGSRVFVSRATLQRIEDGDPRVAVGYLLAASSFLGVPVLSTQGSVQAVGTAKVIRARRKRATDAWFK
ncbi:MAG TPA: helix-turn-helix transcriptional regulator [Verrucomicrobiae bacterium]|nr:helix-turn-helix transcriptional regulator [Verrucomicrobiae bacterium]